MAEACVTGQSMPASSVPEVISETPRNESNDPSGFEPVLQKMKYPLTVFLKK